jgi:hypothetical protein
MPRFATLSRHNANLSCKTGCIVLKPETVEIDLVKKNNKLTGKSQIAKKRPAPAAGGLSRRGTKAE